MTEYKEIGDKLNALSGEGATQEELDEWYSIIGLVYAGDAGTCQQMLERDLASSSGERLSEIDLARVDALIARRALSARRGSES